MQPFQSSCRRVFQGKQEGGCDSAAAEGWSGLELTLPPLLAVSALPAHQSCWDVAQPDSLTLSCPNGAFRAWLGAPGKIHMYVTLVQSLTPAPPRHRALLATR